MKITIKNNFDVKIPPQADRTIDVEISTADLIAELEKRRPCEKCKDYQQVVCGNCVWDSLGQEDNFKEAAK